MYPPVEQTTRDGYDLQFGTNVIGACFVRRRSFFSILLLHRSLMPAISTGHFYLTNLLLPLMIESAKTSADGKARVINTSSMGHTFVSGIDFDTIRDGPKRIKAGTMKLYSQSKFVSGAGTACLPSTRGSSLTAASH